MRALIFALVVDCGGAHAAAEPAASGANAAAEPAASGANAAAPNAAAPAAAQEGPTPAGGPEPAAPRSGISSSSTPAGREAPSRAPAAPSSDFDVAVRIGEIAAAPQFDPQATIETLRPDILACYRKALATNATIHGKVTLRIQLAESGAVERVEAEAGGPASDPGLIGCIRDDFKANARFPKPGGSATVLAPLVFLFRAR